MNLISPMKINKKEPYSPGIRIKDKNHLSGLIGNTISLKVLQFLQENMQPHHHSFSILDIASIIERYVERELQPPVVNQAAVEEEISSTVLPLSPQLRRNISDNAGHSFQLKRDEALQALMEQLRSVFVYWGRTFLSYQNINEYIYNQQLRILNSQHIDEDYMQIGEKRVRIDENLKLCIMPLAYSGDQNSRIRELVFRENMIGSETETVFAVTRNNIRGVHIRPQLIGIAGDYDRNGLNPNSCWYHYDKESISPKKETIAATINKNQSKTALTSAQIKEIKATKLTNLQQNIPSHQLLILKAEAGKSIIAIICIDLSFIVQPLRVNSNQGYIGNLTKDIPPVVVYPESREVYQQILALHCYNDNSWLILTQRFIYLYQIPTPSQNIILEEQNNTIRDHSYKQNQLLLLCQRLPSGCLKAQVLGQKHVALMLQSNCVVVIQLIISNRGIFQGKQLRPEENYFKITNKIYNDIQFKSICYNPKEKYLFMSDFGAFLIRLAFSPVHGDIEQEGPVHDKEENHELNVEMIKNSYLQLRASRSKAQVRAIREVEEEQVQNEEPYIQVYYIKGAKQRQQRHLLSLYKKQNKSPHTVIIKNQTRQIITLITTSPHYNTLITYESQTFEKSNMSQIEGDFYREWGNKNTIKLWDARHMTIYQTVKITIQASLLQLRANGLYFLTAEKGYLGFYQFNEDKKAMIGSAQQRILDRQNREVIQQLGDQILLEGGTLYFTSLSTTYNKFNNVRTHRTHISSFTMQRFPESSYLQTLPSEVSSIAVKSRIYILQNSRQGVQACQLHIYNRQGVKEEMIIYSYREDIDVATGKVRHQNYNQEFKNIKKVNHNQFQVVLWNADCLRLIGLSRQESLTVIFNASKVVKGYEDVSIYREVKSIEINGPKLLIYYQQTVKSKDYGNLSTNRETSNAINTLVVRKRRKSSVIGKTMEQSYHNIAIFNCQNDRLLYKLERISHRIKVLHIFNSLLLTREEDPSDSNFDIIRVIDIAEPGDLINKYLYSAKLQKLWHKKVTMGELKDYSIFQGNPQKNEIIQNVRQFTLKKHIQIDESKIMVSSSNQLMLVLVLRVQTQLLPGIGEEIIRGQVQFMIYNRNITNELINRDYKISRLQIGVKTKKNIKEYQTSTTRTENVNDNKEISFQSLSSLSNYGQIDMQQLCFLILEKGNDIPTTDITNKIVAPSTITTSKTKDTYELLNINKQPNICKVFGPRLHKIQVLSASNFKIVQFDQDKLAGVAVLYNKLLKVMAVYNLSFDCSRPHNEQEQPYRLSIEVDKVGIIEAQAPADFNLQSNTVNILEWSHQYKSQVDKLWDQTFNSIKTFLRRQRQQRQLQRSKSKSKSPRRSLQKVNETQPTTNKLSLDLRQLPALKIRKVQMLKRKLELSERHYTEATPRVVEDVEEQAENISKMFKKWSINQTIAREKQQIQANGGLAENKSTNRYINRLLNSEKDRIQRIQQLITASHKIKEASRSPVHSERVGSPSPQSSSRLNELQSIVKSSEIANSSTLQSYLLLKRHQRSNTIASNPFVTISDPTLSRQQSHISSQVDFNLKPPLHSDSVDIRQTNISKISLYSNLTQQTSPSKKKDDSKMDVNSFQGKLTQKLQELMLRSSSEHKRISTLPCEGSPQRKKTNSTRNQFVKSRLAGKNQEQRANQTSNSNKKYHYSGISYTINHSETPTAFGSPENIKASQRNPSHRYKTEQTEIKNSILRMQSLERKSKKGKRDSQRQAQQKLKQSQSMLKQVYLPQILSNKQKLMLKMKQKKSYVKIVQEHINVTNLSSIRNGDNRKKLVNMLCQYK